MKTLLLGYPIGSKTKVELGSWLSMSPTKVDPVLGSKKHIVIGRTKKLGIRGYLFLA